MSAFSLYVPFKFFTLEMGVGTQCVRKSGIRKTPHSQLEGRNGKIQGKRKEFGSSKEGNDGDRDF